MLVALRDAIRRREVFIDGARRWRDPDHDLPADFDATKRLHYESLRQPTDPAEFIAEVRQRMTVALSRFDAAITGDNCGGVRIVTRHGEPWITVPRMDALPEPVRLELIKAEVQRRWGTLDLLDVLKDSDFLCEPTNEFVSTASSHISTRSQLQLPHQSVDRFHRFPGAQDRAFLPAAPECDLVARHVKAALRR